MVKIIKIAKDLKNTSLAIFIKLLLFLQLNHS